MDVIDLGDVDQTTRDAGPAFIAFQVGQEVREGHGAAQPEPLGLGAAGVQQEVEDRAALHPFRDRLDAQLMGHLDAGAHQGRAFVRGLHAPDQALVDLDRREGPLAQHLDGREARAEVIHGQPQAHAGQLQDVIARLTRTVDDRGFRQFGLQEAGVELEFGDGGAHGLHDLVGFQVPGRQVEGHDQAGEYVLNDAQVGHEPGEHGQGHLLDHTGLDGQGDEVVGRYDLAIRLDPAHQGLGAGDLAGQQGNLGLVVINEFLVPERLLDCRELYAVTWAGRRGSAFRGDTGMELGYIARHAVTAYLLGEGHGHVGVLGQFLLILAMLGVDGDADAQGYR